MSSQEDVPTRREPGATAPPSSAAASAPSATSVAREGNGRSRRAPLTWRFGWRTVLYLAYVAGDAATSLTQSARPFWQDLMIVVLLAPVVVAVLQRHRWPLLLPLLAIPLSVAGASLVPVAVFSLVLRRRDRVTALVLVAAGLAVLAPWSEPLASLTTTGPAPGWLERGAAHLELAVNVVAEVVVPALIGAYVATRRRLAVERSARARLLAEARVLREREAILAERRRIAAEMHDAVGHQLALISMQAGALEVNPGAGADVVERHASAVRSAAGSAAADLRAILDVLGSDDSAPFRPQPGLAELSALLDDARAAGAHVRAEVRIGGGGPAGPGDAVGRAVYRIVQESLTNALTHAPGEPVEVTVAGAPATGVRIDVVNPLPETGRAADGSGEGSVRTGSGLRGLAERARSVGGSMTGGAERAPDGSRSWAVRVRLPWSEEER